MGNPSDKKLLENVTGLLNAARLWEESMREKTVPKHLTEEEQLENLRKIFDLADKEAEKMNRRDCIRVQKVIEEIRQREIEKHL